MLYTYCIVALRDGSPETSTSFADYVENHARQAASEANGELLGFFLPQLGFQAHERALLLRWRGEPTDVFGGSPLIGSLTIDRLRATARPAETDTLRAGGIVVHRWFVIDPRDAEEFVGLSKAAWVGFEHEFNSQVFGLFTAEPRPEDGASVRMLLLTRYGSHADWEASRRPSGETLEKFLRRRDLTRMTRACSAVVAPIR